MYSTSVVRSAWDRAERHAELLDWASRLPKGLIAEAARARC
jgi:hypothetical protein